VSLEQCKCGERYEQWGRQPAPSCSKCAKNHVRKASSGKTGTEQGGSKGKQAKCDSRDGKCERKREKIQHPRKAVKKPKTKADIRHFFSDPAHSSRVRLSAASLTNPFHAPILRQEVDHDPMPMDAYGGSSEQSRCDFVATNSSALSLRDLPPLQLKVNLPLLQVEFDRMQTDERSQHSEEPFVDKDTLRLRARAPSPWHSTLVPRHVSNMRASGLRHDVFNRIGPLKLDHQAISPGSSALRSRNAPNPRKGVSRTRPSNGDPSTRHCTGISRLALKPRRSFLRSLQRVSSLQAGSCRAHLSNESSLAPSLCEQPPISRPWLSSQPSQALQPPRTFEGPLQVGNMSEDDWELDLESAEEPPSDDESRGQSNGAGSSMGSDGCEN